MAWFDGLTPGTPKHSIASTTNARVRVVAGPVTGASFAMKPRVARLIEAGVAPDFILPVTLTRIVAQDPHLKLVDMGGLGRCHRHDRECHPCRHPPIAGASVMRVTAISTQTERKRQDSSDRCAEKYRR